VTNATRWVGIDLHRRRSQIAIIDDQGELALSRRIVNDRDTFGERALRFEIGSEVPDLAERRRRGSGLREEERCEREDDDELLHGFSPPLRSAGV